jgi:hypothetical protein
MPTKPSNIIAQVEDSGMVPPAYVCRVVDAVSDAVTGQVQRAESVTIETGRRK